MDAIFSLLAIEQIKQLKARYFRSLDTKDWLAFAGVFTEDAEIDVVQSTVDSRSGSSAVADLAGAGIMIGGSAYADFVREVAKDIISVHHGHMPEIEITSATTARGIWAMEDVVLFRRGAHRSMHGYGHYHETYQCIADRWLIRSLRITRLRVDLA